VREESRLNDYSKLDRGFPEIYQKELEEGRRACGEVGAKEGGGKEA